MSKIFFYGLSALMAAAVVLIVFNTGQAFAHRDGCHRWHSCPSDSGNYVCGDLGYSSGCGYTPVLPRVPIITTRDEAREEKVDFKTITKYDYREYPGYTRVKQVGKSGVRLIVARISLTDGTETSRADISNSISTSAVDQVIVNGGRTKAVAKIYGIANSSPGFLGMDKGKFNVWGKYKASSEVYLFANKVEVGKAYSNSEGWFTFENVRIDKIESWLLVFERVKGRINTLSEKTQVNTETKKVTTEYDIIHPKSKKESKP
jgi:hypothetical protein